MLVERTGDQWGFNVQSMVEYRPDLFQKQLHIYIYIYGCFDELDGSYKWLHWLNIINMIYFIVFIFK